MRSRKSAEFRTFSKTSAPPTPAAPRQKIPTIGNPPSACMTPPMDAPPKTPTWLLTANIPIAVLRELSANFNNSVGVIEDDTLSYAETPKAKATVSQGETSTNEY